MLDLIAEHKDVVKAFKVYVFEQEGSLFRFKAEIERSLLHPLYVFCFCPCASVCVRG